MGRQSALPRGEWSRWLLAAGGVALLTAVAVLYARFPAFEFVLRVATHVLSTRETVSPEHRAAFATLLLETAVMAAAAGAFLVALSVPRWRRPVAAAIDWDALRSSNLATPNPRRVLWCATLAGLLVIGTWLARARLGPPVQNLFAKEGPFEHVTFLLELVGAVLCFLAAWRWKVREPKAMRGAAVLYTALGVVLFVVAGEEINWGQTLLGFATPEGWSKLNYQHETSIHNLVDKSVLTETWKLVSVAFGLGVLATIALSVRFPRSIAGAIAPHPSLAPLALCASYAGARLHPELIELLLSVFFAFYSYRIWVAARSSSHAAAGAPDTTARSEPAGAGTRARRLLRYGVAISLIAILLYRVDWSQVALEVRQISSDTLASAFVAMGIGLVISAWKWDWALRLHDLRYPYPFLLRTLCIGFFLNSFLPTAVGGDAYRVVRTLPRDGYRSRALSAVIIERAMGLIALIALGSIGALKLAEHYAVARQYCYILLAIAALGIAGFIALEGGWLERVASRWRGLPALDAVQHNIGLLRNRRGEWLGLIAGSLAFQLVSIGVIFLLFAAVGTSATPSQCALIAAAVGVAAALPISVNGVGVMEGAMVAAAVALKLDYEHALMVAFARRGLAVCLAVPCGFLWTAEARYLHLSENRAGFLGLLQTFWRDGFRGLVQALQPQAWSPPLVAEADVPLAAAPADIEPQWLQTQMLEFTHDAIIIWEMQGKGIVYWNRAAEQLYGYTRSEAHGQATHELLKTATAEGVTHLENSLARFGVWVGELRHTTREGREVHVEGRLALMSQHNGRWLVLEVNRDVTDRKAAEASRHAMERQLAELRALREARND